jgi:hypothetical protein
MVVPTAARRAATPRSTAPRLWFDALVHTPEALRFVVTTAGADRGQRPLTSGTVREPGPEDPDPAYRPAQDVTVRAP